MFPSDFHDWSDIIYVWCFKKKPQSRNGAFYGGPLKQTKKFNISPRKEYNYKKLV